jgi:hypothetical protein
LQGRYTEPGKATLTLRARLGGKPYEQRVTVRFPATHEEGEAIGTLWARARIEDLSNQQIVHSRPALKEEITQVALEHRLVSAYTSFVAVEEKIVTGSEQPILVEVPVEMPDGVSYEGVFGGEAGGVAAMNASLGRGRMKAAAPRSFAERSLDAAVLTESETAPMKRPEEPKREPVREEDQRAGVLCRIAAARASYRLGEPVEIVVTLENLSGKTARVPANLSTADGTARFQILDAAWKALTHPTRDAAKPPMIELQPGARATLHLILNGAGGYLITKPGTYHIVLLGTGIGLPTSNTLTIRIAP